MIRTNLERTNIKDLKAMAKKNSVKGYSKMNKAELVDALYDVLSKPVGVSNETKAWAEEHKGEDHPDTFPPRVEEDAEVKEEKSTDLTDDYEFYRTRSTKIRSYHKTWGGKERSRYKCGHCGCKIGNPTDHFCYTCGYKFDGVEDFF